MTDSTKKAAEMQSRLKAEGEGDSWLPRGQDAPSDRSWQQLARLRSAADNLAAIATDEGIQLPDNYRQSAVDVQTAVRECLEMLHHDWVAQSYELILRVHRRVSDVVTGRRLDEPEGLSDDSRIIH